MTKETSTATAAIIFAMFFWAPWINLFFSPIAIILGIRSIARIRKDPKTYGGMKRSVFAVLISTIVLWLSIAGWIINNFF